MRATSFHRPIPIIVLFEILAVGWGLRFHGLGNKSLWFDEAISWRMSTFPVTDVIARCGSEGTVHPPLYFLLLKAWRGLFGESEFAMRALAAILGVLTIGAMAGFVREACRLSFAGEESDVATSALETGDGRKSRRSGPEAALLAAVLSAALVAVNALQIHASKQVRMYSLGTFLVLCSGLLLCRALRARSRGLVAWSIFTAVALAAAYSHYFAALSVAFQGLFAIGYLAVRFAVHRDPAEQQWTRAQFQNVLFAVGALVTLYSPWVVSVVRHSRTFQSSFHTPTTVRGVAGNIAEALVGTPADVASVELVVGAAACALLLALFALLCARRTPTAWLLISTGLGPPFVCLIYSLFSARSAFYSRYLGFAQLSWLAGLAYLIGCVRHAPERLILSAWALAWGAYSCWASWAVIGPSTSPGVRSAVQHILNERTDDEIVLVRSPFDCFTVLYYARDQGEPPRLCSDTGNRLGHECPAHLADSDLITADVLATNSARGGWLLRSHAYKPDPACDISLPAAWLQLDSQPFERDYRRWEDPLVVVHYRESPAREP